MISVAVKRPKHQLRGAQLVLGGRSAHVQSLPCQRQTGGDLVTRLPVGSVP